MNVDEFLRRFSTIAAKFNLVFAYHSASEKSFNEIQLQPFALARNYADFCFIDMQRILLKLYKNSDQEFFDSLEKKVRTLEEFLILTLKNLDNLPK